MRYIAMCLREALHKKFPESSEDDVLKVSIQYMYHIVLYHFYLLFLLHLLYTTCLNFLFDTCIHI